MYTFQSRVRYSELDPERKLSIASIVDYFQDCSTFHSEQLGVGLDYLEERDMLWVMSYWQIVIDRYPKLCDNITIGTFPYEFKGFMGYRNFFIKDEAGEDIIRANSIWSLINLKTGRPVRPPEEMLTAYQLETKLPMDYEPRKIVLPDGGRREASLVVGKQHFAIGQMRAEYRKSALLHDCIVPEVFEQENLVSVSLCDEAGQPYAVVEFRKKKQ